MHLASLPIMLLLFSLLRVMKGRALQQRPMSTTKQRLVMRMCSFGDGPAAEDPLVRHLVGRGSEITPYWIDKLRGIRRPKAVAQLVPSNPLGFDLEARGAGRVAEWAVEQKRSHSDKLIIFRQGEFYETYGVDSLMLAEHLGLNLMGSRREGSGLEDAPRAGFPVKNLQGSLKELVAAGLSIAMYEQLVDVDADRGQSRKTKVIKERAFTQTVSPGHSAYLYDLCLSTDSIEFGEDAPAVGLMNTAGGLLLCEVFISERVITVSERMTEESVRAALEPYGGNVCPFYAQDAQSMPQSLRDTSFPPWVTQVTGYSAIDFPSIVLQKVADSFDVDVASFSVRRKSYEGRPRPVYTSTALQVGLVANRNVPALVPQLLPRDSPAHVHRFLRRWISAPPPQDIAGSMRSLCRALGELKAALPLVSPVPLSKAVSLLLARQANTQLFREILANAQAVEAILAHPLHGLQGSGPGGYRELLPHLLAIIGYESGIPVTFDQLLAGSRRVAERVCSVIPSDAELQSDPTSRPSTDSRAGDGKRSERINAFFERNEAEFRGLVKGALPAVAELYRSIQEASSALQAAIEEHYPADIEVVYDINNNRLHMVMRKSTRTPSSVGGSFVVPRDREGKEIPGGRYTTEEVEQALLRYRAAAAAGPAVVTAALQQLSRDVSIELMSIQHCCHFANILYAVNEHAASARQRGWVLPSTPGVGVQRLMLTGATPYWISRDRAARNDVDMEGIFLLTAPNMAGKSTLMRTVLVCALLGNCGLYVPCEQACIPRYDNFFLRTASFDVPSEAKSAFALEMEDVRVAMRDVTSSSLVMIDELGKGTSSRDGASLAGAVLEWLDHRGVSGIFATHLHEVFLLDLKLTTVKEKMMAYKTDGDGNIQHFLYSLQDGRCTDSLALHTARSSGVDESVVRRAALLAIEFDAKCRPNEGSIAKSGRPRKHKPAPVECRPVESYIYTPGSGAAAAAALPQHTLECIAAMAFPEGGFCTIEPHESPPPSLEGSSCVYIIQAVGERVTAVADTIYVGETDSIRQRLAQHRSHTFRGRGVRAAVAQQRDKTSARRAEAAIIAALKAQGVVLANESDGSRL